MKLSEGQQIMSWDTQKFEYQKKKKAEGIWTVITAL